MKYYAVLAITMAISLSSCKNKDEVQNQQPVEVTDNSTKNDQEIKAYLDKNNLKAEKTDSGLYYIITEEGTGASATAESNVTVAYKGYFTNGNTFDQSGPEGISFGLNQVIPGWTEGIQKFKEGGKGVLLIPSSIGYGNDTKGPIPGGSVLLFDINLISVQ
ncbi:FKBP-type peptidyl-prolyl cis-trans isomerase [Flavobacterium sp. 7A]|uniref:FKBP-type peptidyl-prolyl cis-trans isomerase n=1 Tax=Flavobacterium sp. 7A TaxID=2940571 RepID=UPI0022280113|nr:FKBP-type peptidyl-prolyl cis-trans isomerase [Flavobacterium sp. 7A]MCW2121098.1 FKBP-type peptidyl-prolyl cis-trans isomerase [Flavobacterium sp. 7A]